MPFKTKRQKLAASQRKFSFSKSGSFSYDGAKTKLESSATSAKTVELSQDQIEDLAYVNKDSIRIAFGAFGIIFFQLLLYIALRS